MKNIGIKRVGMDENTTTNHEADVSSRCPFIRGVEEWWVSCSYVESRGVMRHWWDNVSIKTKLAQREAFIYSVRMKVSGSLEKGKNANCYVVGGVVWKV